MRVPLPCAALAVAMLGTGEPQLPVAPARDYAALVHDYVSGNADEAVTRMAALGRQGLFDRFSEFTTTSPPASLLTAAAALHTEVGLRSPVDSYGPLTNRQLDLATAIVEIGTPPKLKRLGSHDFRKSGLAPVPAHFRRLWYLTVISVMENGGRTDVAQAYLENARALFPRDPEFLLLSGIGDEMRASDRLTPVSAGERRKWLGSAEVHLRASLELAPDRLETRLRLGRVLWQRDHSAEARGLLATVSEAPDARLSYLASLFLGGLEDAAGNPAGAARWYAHAAAKMPSGQAALVAGSELQHRAGERHEAALTLAAAVGTSRDDPWWAYLFGEYWRIDLYLNAMRKMAQS